LYIFVGNCSIFLVASVFHPHVLGDGTFLLTKLYAETPSRVEWNLLKLYWTKMPILSTLSDVIVTKLTTISKRTDSDISDIMETLMQE